MIRFLTIQPLKLLPAMLSAEAFDPPKREASVHAQEVVRYMEFVRARGARGPKRAREVVRATALRSKTGDEAYRKAISDNHCRSRRLISRVFHSTRITGHRHGPSASVSLKPEVRTLR